MKNIMLVEAEIWTVARTDKGNAVLVKPVGSDRAVPIFIGQLEAQSILFGLSNVPVPRPMTHDLLIAALEKLGVSVERVEITDLKDRTFYARIVLKNGLKRITLDSRPSDSLGLAARIHCPVFIAESIVDEAGIAVSLIEEESDDSAEETGEITDLVRATEETQRKVLEAALATAVEKEDYEEAARLRDELKNL